MAALFTIQNEFRYEIIRKIFEGGMGIVYEAEQHGARNFVKRVALKVIRQNYANQKTFIENFIGEAKLVADLIHTNIVQTYQLGEARGIYFIAMELIRKARSRLSVKEINTKYGWQDEPRSSPAPPQSEEPTSFHVQVSTDLGHSWTTRSETNQPVHALRLAREASRSDATGLYRAFNVGDQCPLLWDFQF